jgi:hypothetical protein
VRSVTVGTRLVRLGAAEAADRGRDPRKTAEPEHACGKCDEPEDRYHGDRGRGETDHTRPAAVMRDEHRRLSRCARLSHCARADDVFSLESRHRWVRQIMPFLAAD